MVRNSRMKYRERLCEWVCGCSSVYMEKCKDLSAHPNATVVLTGRRQGCVTATSCAARSGGRDLGTHIRSIVDLGLTMLLM